MFQIIDVPYQGREKFEPLGTKRKFWFRDENLGDCLFKEGTEGTGDHWAEKIACELCNLLAVPHADYELATWRGRPGVVPPTFVPEGGTLILENELLGKIEERYPVTQFFNVAQYTLPKVMPS